MVRFIIIAFLALIAAGIAPAADSATRTVMVAPFENLSTAKSMVDYEAATSADPDKPKRIFSVDRYSEAPRGILEDILVKQPGISVIERQRVDSILEEQQFAGLSDPTQAVALGKLVGAQIIVLGTIQDVSAQAKTFSGYGVAVANTTVTASVRVRAIDISTGQVIASSIVEGSEAFTTSRYGGLADSDVAYRVLSAALRKIASDADFLGKVSGRSAASGDQVDVQFSPNPKNADVIIDGVFMGTSPAQVPLTAGKAVTVTLRHAGFADWQNTILPRAGMQVSPDLTPKP